MDANNLSPDGPGFLILGANGGVGSELVRRLRLNGARVLLTGRNIAELTLLGDELDCPYFACDARKPEEVRAAVERAKELFGHLDGAVNCVGSIVLKPAHLTSNEEWIDTIETNLGSSFSLVKFAAKSMMGRGGSIVLISSCAAGVGLPNHEAIAAAKAGVQGLALSAAATYSRHKIRVNCVAPGLLKTKLSKAITSNETQLRVSTDMHPLGRIGQASDVAQAVEYLLSDRSTWVTGQVFCVDGGFSSVRTPATARL